jgi:hypothetical protein
MTGRDPAPSSTVELCAFRGRRGVRHRPAPDPEIAALPVTPSRALPSTWRASSTSGVRSCLWDVRRSPAAVGAHPRLIVNVAGRALALQVDGVSEVVRIPRSAIGPPPALLAAGGQRLFLGVCAGRQERAPASGSRRGSEPVAPTAAGRLRLLLNVKALRLARRPGSAAGCLTPWERSGRRTATARSS